MAAKLENSSLFVSNPFFPCEELCQYGAKKDPRELEEITQTAQKILKKTFSYTKEATILLGESKEPTRGWVQRVAREENKWILSTYHLARQSLSYQKKISENCGFFNLIEGACAKLEQKYSSMAYEVFNAILNPLVEKGACLFFDIYLSEAHFNLILKLLGSQGYVIRVVYVTPLKENPADARQKEQFSFANKIFKNKQYPIQFYECKNAEEDPILQEIASRE